MCNSLKQQLLLFYKQITNIMLHPNSLIHSQSYSNCVTKIKISYFKSKIAIFDIIMMIYTNKLDLLDILTT